MGFIAGILLSVLIGGLLGGLLLRLTLWPAFSMAGARRGRWFGLFSACFLMAGVWLTATLLAQYMTARAIGLHSVRGGLFLRDPWLVVLAVLVFGLGGAVAGWIAERAAPLPRAASRAAIAGLLVGVLVAVPQVARAGGWRTIWDPWVMAAAWLCWLTLPIGAIYVSASLQRRRLRRYRARACVGCGYELAATEPRCTECGSAPQHICHKCRHIVPRQPGQRCAKCAATIGERCWKCGYDLRGVDGGRCPECGVWKPVRAGSERSPAGEESASSPSCPS